MKKTGPERLADYRDKHGYKQYELAELLEVPEAYISQILNGHRRPGLPTAMRIEARTGIPAESWLLTKRGSRKRRQESDAVSVGISNGESPTKLR